MRSFIRNQHGFVIFVSLIMVLISLGFTIGYLQFVMGERILFMQRFAETRARYNAMTGIAEGSGPLIRGSLYTKNDTLLPPRPVPAMVGKIDSIRGLMRENPVSHRSQPVARARGISTYNSFANQPIEVEYTMEVNYSARGFEEFMYLTNEERPGGGPWLGETVTFGSGEILEGLVYSNDDITMSDYGCPTFVNYGEEDDPDFELSQVYTAGTFNFSNCDEDSESLFEGIHQDSMPTIEWPPYEGQDLVKNKADYIYNGSSLINAFDPTHKDRHIMTRLIFSAGQIAVKQWKYIIPPTYQPPSDESQVTFDDTLRKYYPLYYKQINGLGDFFFRGDLELQHFDFPMPPSAELLTDDIISAPEAVIWIEGGQVQVLGEITGRYTVATSGPVPYKLYHDSTIVRELNCNIWIMDDLIYADSNPTTGYVEVGSPNRLGLLSGGNIIVANTRENGARNGGSSEYGGVKINAAMIAMNESFIIQYWQNSTQAYNYMNAGTVKGDGRGVIPFRPHTGTSDIRGTVMIFGSVVQDKRGYLKRNAPGPYQISPGIGYEKDYHYDRNLRTFPPPEWPETKNSDGSSSLELAGLRRIENR